MNWFRNCTVMVTILIAHISPGQNVSTDSSFWTSGSLSTITFSQVSLNNWSAGGESSASVNGFFNAFANFREGRRKWQNTLDLGYGLLKQGSRGVQKSDDKINIVTKFGYQVADENSKWFYTLLMDFRTQFSEGVSPDPDSTISRFMAPGYLTIGTGIEFAPNDFVSFSYQPVTGKITFVTDKGILGTTGAYGVEDGDTYRAELGSYFRFLYKQEVLKNVNLDMRLELFSGYRNKSFGNVDVNWQNSLIMNISKYLSTNFFAQMLYDDDIKTDKVENGIVTQSGPKIQFKTVFGIGLVYQLGANRIE